MGKILHTWGYKRFTEQQEQILFGGVSGTAGGPGTLTGDIFMMKAQPVTAWWSSVKVSLQISPRDQRTGISE